MSSFTPRLGFANEKSFKHREWRKIAKRERRKRIRKELAKKLDPITYLTSEEYEFWIKEQEEIQLLELEKISILNKEENDKWQKAERVTMEKWQKLQEKIENLRQMKLQEEAKLKLEREMEQKQREEEVQRLKEIEDENKRKQKVFQENLEQFLKGDSVDPPEELLISRETRPNADICPFFTKTACCRFGDQCSRNHKYPGISKILLATNFYIHFGLENSNFSEYDTDVMLEFEDSDTYKDFKDFFFDVLPEFEKFGKVVQFKVCNNYEKHLRGNTYVEFYDLRSAVAAYQALHSRWYGGRQLSLQFCEIGSWKNAICGLQIKKRCPKGRACNFLHVFRNPNNLFSVYNGSNYRGRRTPSRSWRWSESPERESPPRRHSSSRSTKPTKRDHGPCKRKSISITSHRKKSGKRD